MPQRSHLYDLVSTSIRKLMTHRLLALLALITIGSASAIPTRSSAASIDQPLIPVIARQTHSIAATHNPNLYLPLVKAPPPCLPAYSAAGPWNTRIGSQPIYDPLSSVYISAFKGDFGSDPTQYTYPVYEVDKDTPRYNVTVSGYFSEVDKDTSITNKKSSMVPIPFGAAPSYGSDSQIVFWNRETGDEWGFTKITLNANGTWAASSGYHYNTNWDGSPPLGQSKFASRGSGLPFLAGLIRPCEISLKQINHALAFAYDSPSALSVLPATKSDGDGVGLPEGARIQLNPALTDQQIQAWGCTNACLTIAHAMQRYGMYVVDRSSRPKIFVEYDATAKWNSVIKYSTIAKIPYTELRVLKIFP